MLFILETGRTDQNVTFNQISLPFLFQRDCAPPLAEDVSQKADDLLLAFPFPFPFPIPISFPFSFSFLFPFPSMTLFNMMYVDGDTPVGSSTNQLTHRRAADACCEVLVAKRNRSGRRRIRLRNEDQVVLRVGRH